MVRCLPDGKLFFKIFEGIEDVEVENSLLSFRWLRATLPLCREVYG